MRITTEIRIVLPFADSETMTAVRANEEAEIDFRNDPQRAARCTMSFAAVELQTYLRRSLNSCNICFASKPPADGVVLELNVEDKTSRNGSFRLEPLPNGLRITGKGRTGVLYGAYELLRLQGWRWMEPGDDGEVIPVPRDEIQLPTQQIVREPSFDLGRGFDFECPSMESLKLWLWMARNRMNVVTPEPGMLPLCNKLGMTFKAGGHIFENILDPDRFDETGRTLWDTHQDWYGLPASGRRTRERAQKTQFCVSQPDLAEFIGRELVQKLSREWNHLDRIDIWGFDTWGDSCCCPACQDMGNGSDKMLHFLSGLRTHINNARQSGELDRDVQMILCAYEGTGTIFGPERLIPANLIEAGDMVVFYPINRCYEHAFGDSECPFNAKYHKALKSWTTLSPAMPVVVGEYYNVSKFEDLPCLFTSTMVKDIPEYRAVGARGMTYMHVPACNWAMRSVTQELYARLLWRCEIDLPSFLDDYVQGRYGWAAASMQNAYDHIEKAWTKIADWRCWGARSVLKHLMSWDGDTPDVPFPTDNHFASPEDIIEQGESSIRHMQAAMELIETNLHQAKIFVAEHAALPAEQVVNPQQQKAHSEQQHIEFRLAEDRRFLTYGLDIMRLTTLLVAYYNALHADSPQAAETLWQDIEAVASRLENQYVPICLEYRYPGFYCKDALTRSQLSDLLSRCRRKRLMRNQ